MMLVAFCLQIPWIVALNGFANGLIYGNGEGSGLVIG